MSYILDALKKLEQKRFQSEVPDLLTIHDEGFKERKERASWPYFLLAVLILNAALLTVWILPRKSQKTKDVVHSAAGQEQRITAFKQDATTTGLPDSNKTPEDTRSIVTEIRTKNNTALSDPLSIQVPDENDTIQDASPQQSVPVDVHDQKVVSEEHRSKVQTRASLSVSPDVKDEIVSRSQTLPEREYPVTLEKEPGQEVLDVNELPPSVRQDLPDINISGHIYSDEPDSRIVNINGLIARGGETVDVDLKVVEITETGVIFSYRGFRFHMRAF
jgi:general secretion pathway protein B